MLQELQNRKLEALLPSFEKAKKRGVNIKVAAPITKDNIKVARDFSKVAEIRGLTKPQGRFAIIDSAQLMFMLLDDKSIHPNYDVAVWLSTDFFAQAMAGLIEQSWKSFTPLSKVKVK